MDDELNDTPADMPSPAQRIAGVVLLMVVFFVGIIVATELHDAGSGAPAGSGLARLWRGAAFIVLVAAQVPMLMALHRTRLLIGGFYDWLLPRLLPQREQGVE